MFKVKKNLTSNEFATASPAPFVGRYGYPYVNVGILIPPEAKDAWLKDAPRHWAGKNFQIPEIVDLRSSLVNSRFRANIRKQNKMLDISQEIGMASRPVDIEVRLEDKPRFRLNTSEQMAPTGPLAKLECVDVTSNPKIDRRVDKVVSDNDLKATNGINYLYKHGYDENFLTRAFSIGNLGMKKDRKLVPTRWSITAVDDTISKHLHEHVRDLQQLGEHLAFFGSYLGNYYLILFIPDVWSYELFETYMPNASWNVSDEMDYMTDYENHAGRKTYAGNCTGGYYSVRLAILEKLKSMKRQASAIAIRVITGEYSAPLGVWVTREAARKALAEKPLRFGSLDLMINYAKSLGRKKFGFEIIGKSRLLKNIQTQLKLTSF